MLLAPVSLKHIISFLRADEKQINRSAKSGRGTRDQDREMADRISHEPPEYFLFKQIPALVDPLPVLQPLKPDGTGRHNDSLQFPVYGCLLAMFPDHIHSNIQPLFVNNR
jgi:hypothetical protein